MNYVDEWGRDPAVRAMRTVFKGMEDAQREFFDRMGIDRFDIRIRSWREKALDLYEKAFFQAHNSGKAINEKTASNIYLHCLARVMKGEGLEIPDDYLPDSISTEVL